MLQYSFQSFFITAEKPTLGFFVTVIAGVVNAVLDAVFIICFSWGLAGAAAATVIGQVVGGIVPIIYFLRKNDSLLQLLRPVFSFRVLVSACTNGSSELLTNISSSVVAILYNSILLSVAGDDGVIAYGVIMYMNTVFMGIFYGFAMGISPIIGFHYGAKNQDELKGLFRRGLFILTVMGVILFGLAEALSVPFAAAFTSSDVARELTQYGIWIYSIAYILMGINVYGSAFFTALGAGGASAFISFLRTFLFQCGAVLLLSFISGITGIWAAIILAEGLSLIVTAILLLTLRKKYGY